jgi:hypothetical protein
LQPERSDGIIIIKEILLLYCDTFIPYFGGGGVVDKDGRSGYVNLW